MNKNEKEAIKEWEDATVKIKNIFIKKYFPPDPEDWWVGNKIGDVLFVNDYFFNLDNIITAIENNISEKIFNLKNYDNSN